MKLSKKLLKEIYEFVDENLKAKIEIEVPGMKPTLEVGKWYKSHARLVFRTGDDNNYGFCRGGIWKTDLFCYEVNNWKLATPEEVKTALVNEAKKRGFKEGVKYSFENCKNITAIGSLSFNFQGELNDLYFKDSVSFIFKKGTWATIINEPTEKELLIEKANKVEAELIELKKQINELR